LFGNKIPISLEQRNLSQFWELPVVGFRVSIKEFNLQTLVVHKPGFNQSYHTFTLILPTNIVLCSEFSLTKSINYKFLDMKLINCLVSWQAVTDAQMLRRDKMAIDEEVRAVD